MENEFGVVSKNLNLFINDQIRKFLQEIIKWAKFLTILGFLGTFILLGASLIIGVIALFTTEFDSLPIHPIFFAIIYFIPCFSLLRFSINLNNEVNSNNINLLEDAFLFLKSQYKFIGISAIVIITLYILFFICGIVFGLLN